MQAWSYKRETNLTDFNFMQIIEAENLDTLYDGFIGLAPHQANDGVPKEMNFMW
jgi:hypothetical protein